MPGVNNTTFAFVVHAFRKMYIAITFGGGLYPLGEGVFITQSS